MAQWYIDESDALLDDFDEEKDEFIDEATQCLDDELMKNYDFKHSISKISSDQGDYHMTQFEDDEFYEDSDEYFDDEEDFIGEMAQCHSECMMTGINIKKFDFFYL